jgi:hypothetical protein
VKGIDFIYDQLCMPSISKYLNKYAVLYCNFRFHILNSSVLISLLSLTNYFNERPLAYSYADVIDFFAPFSCSMYV